MNFKKKPTYEQALEKLRQYCAYQERCHQEVEEKLYSLALYAEWRERIVAQLIEENFLNEERFARVFAGGKFRIKAWGRLRIERELKSRRVSAYCIRKALKEEIDEQAYRQTLKNILDKKQEQYAELPDYQARIKAIRYALSRGYEMQIINEILGD